MMIKKSSKQNKNNRRGGTRARRNTIGGLQTYPPYNSQFTIPLHLRYESSTASNTATITNTRLMNAIGVSNGANGYVTLFAAAKLNKVEIRGISSAVNKITTLAFCWIGNYDSSREITASGNTEHPLHMVCRPNPRSLTGMWLNSTSAQNLFRVVTDADFGEGTIDVWFDVVLYDDQSAHYEVTTAAGTANAVYTSALDGVGGTPRWIPVGRGTIV